MRDLLNKKAFAAFKQRCQSAGVHEVHLSRREQGREVRYHLNAREPRSKRILTAEWVLDRGPDLAAKESSFLDFVLSEFVVREHGPQATAEAEAPGAEAAKATQPAPAKAR